MPSIILVRIGVVADPSNHKTGKVVHQASRFHLKADAILTKVSNNPITHSGVVDERVARCNGPVVNIGIRSVSIITLNLVNRVTAPTAWTEDVVV